MPEINGWLNVLKPQRLTSFDVIRHLKKILPAKYGHAGSLDPMATGVLVVAVNNATKHLSCVVDMRKTYVFKVRWGMRTDTDDLDGTIIQEGMAVPDKEAIEQALPCFVGQIEQVPPAYSACKIKGKRAYDLARRGEAFVLQPKVVTVHDLILITHDQGHSCFEMTCSKGTYVRAVARDLAEKLGTLATVSILTRICVGAFHINEAVPLGSLQTASDVMASLLALENSAKGLSMAL